MISASFPEDEDQRIEALRALWILDTPAEERFDRLTRIAKRHYQVPAALLSLVDKERQWSKSKQGFDLTETPRDISFNARSFCAHAIRGDGVLYVGDARDDPRFSDNPRVVGPPNIRFYAGAPVSAPGGWRIGTLCIIDTKPRTFSSEDFGVLRDLADCVEAELVRQDLPQNATLAQTQGASLRAVLDTAVDGIITIDGKGRVETFNPAAEHIFGFSAGDVIGQNVSVLMPEPHRGAHDGYIGTYLATGEAKIIGIGQEVVGRRKDGTTFPMDLAVSEIHGGDKPKFTGIVRDITERKRAEREILDRSTLLEAANKELDAFAYTVSHDLRAPLRAMDGFSRALAEDYGEKLDGAAHDYLSRISGASQRMGRMIDDILALSRTTRGKMSFEDVDLSDLAQTILVELKEGAPDRRASFDIEPALKVRGDHRLLKIVLDNLLGNAWKFTGKNDTAHIKVGACQHNGERTYLVADDGVGFDMAYADKLFGVFDRLHKVTEFDGTGIGLATVARLIHRHGGRVWAEGIVGTGATFYFTLGT